MTDVSKSSLWVCKRLHPDSDGTNDTVGFELQGHGNTFHVFVSGPSGATGNELIGALRAAAATLIIRLHGDPSDIDAGCRAATTDDMIPPTGKLN